MRSAIAGCAFLLVSTCSWSSTDDDMAKSKAATTAARVSLGALIGGKVGKLVKGGATGTGAGIIFSSSEISCAEGESCAEGYRRVPIKPLPPPRKPAPSGSPGPSRKRGVE